MLSRTQHSVTDSAWQGPSASDRTPGGWLVLCVSASKRHLCVQTWLQPLGISLNTPGGEITSGGSCPIQAGKKSLCTNIQHTGLAKFRKEKGLN